MRISHRTFIKAVLVLAFAAAPLAADAQTVRYRVVPLPDVATPHVVCLPTAINENGDVAGFCVANGLQEFAVVWRAGTATDLGTLPGGTFARAWAINSAGEMVGEGDNDNGDLTAKAIAYRNGTWMEIDGSGGSLQNAYGITSAGVVFGNFTTTGSPGTQDWDPVYWTFDPDRDEYVRNDLPKAPGDLFSGAFVYAVSPSGVAVGQVATNTVGNRAALWMDDAAHSLVLLGVPAEFSAAALAFGVSDDGRAAGYAASGLNETAVLWQNDALRTVVNIGRLPGDALSRAYGVNNVGRAVGVSYPGLQTIGRGFVYHEGTLTALTDVLDPADAGWTINEAVGINNAGRIVATATFNGVRQPVLLEPFEATAITSVTLSASHTAPQNAGTTITFTASAQGGTSPYQFKWRLSNGSTTTTVKDWSTSATFEWTPFDGNPNYQVTVWARSDGNSADEAEQTASMSFPIVAIVTHLTLSADRSAPQPTGTSIGFTATASGGTEPYEFKWLVSDGATSTVVQEWSGVATFTWTPATPNANYSMVLWARSAGNTADAAEAQVILPFAIVPARVTQLTLSADRGSPQLAGTSIGFTAVASGGTEPYAFKWLVSDGSTSTVLRDWDAATTLTWTPTIPADNYQVTVWARSAGNTADAPEAQVTLSFQILRPLVASVTLTADRAAPQVVGTTITFAAAATGGTEPYEFKWLINDGTTATVAQDWGAAATFTWTPATANDNYQIIVWVRGAGNTVDAAEQSASLAFPIVAAPEPPDAPHDNRDGLKPLPGKRLGKGAPDYSRGHQQ